MGHVALPLALVVAILVLPGPRPAAPLPQLSKADEEWVAKKYREAATFGRKGKWGYDEAQGPVREILDLCTRKLGKDHYKTADYRREIEVLEKLARLPEVGRVEYMKTYPMSEEIDALVRKGRYADALGPAEQVLDIYRRRVGPGSTYAARAASWCGGLLFRCERYSDAEAQFREALKIYRGVVGNNHPDTAPACGNLAMTLHHQGRYAEARPLYDEAVGIALGVHGKDHPDTAQASNNLATHLDDRLQHAEAEPLLRHVLETLCREEGKESYRAFIARNNLSYNLDAQGRYAEAEPLCREVIDIRLNRPGDVRLAAAASGLALTAQRLHWENHPDTALAYNNLAVNLNLQGRYAEAETLYRQSIAIYRAFDPDGTLRSTAAAYKSLAVALDHLGKYEEAERLYETAAQIFLRVAKGKKDRRVANVYYNWATTLARQGKLTAAQKMHEEALAIARDVSAQDHPEDIADCCNELAFTLGLLGEHTKAEPLFREAVDLHRRTRGPEHPVTTGVRHNLAVNLHHQGRHAEAGPELESVLTLFRGLLGQGHPKTVRAYRNLALHYCARGEYAKAAALTAAAADGFEAARLRASFAGTDRAGAAAELSPLPALAVAAARRGRPVAAWQTLERDLARGLLDDLAAHPLSDEERRREQALVGKLDLLDRRVGLLRAGGPRADAERRAAEKDRDAAQAELVEFQAGLVAAHGVAAGRVYDLARVLKQVPEDAALLAWVDLPIASKWDDPRGDHWACLLKRDGDPVWVQLPGSGPGNAWTAEDDGIADQARRAFSARPDDPNAGWKDLADKLARQRLAPLEKHLKGIRHLIVLPSAKMAGVPVEALPGADLTVSYAPSGTMFAWLREKPREVAPARLLALGNPAFRPQAGGGPAPLPGTREELSAIGRVFDESRLLMGPEASEQNLDRLAAEEGGLRRFPYLHFATHGVLDDRRPMRSALLLAQDRLPDPLTQLLDGKETYDGRLTAERILRRWNRRLDAELVTLSACRTGLGRYSGGEGYLGFSQALFVAGARSLVLSLWDVDDTATALLMTRFYENLMGLPEGLPGGPVAAMPKAEALAKAKEWLRGLKPEEVDQLRKDLPARGTRGRIEKKKPAATTAALSYDHPYYWSGFVLVGDPR